MLRFILTSSAGNFSSEATMFLQFRLDGTWLQQKYAQNHKLNWFPLSYWFQKYFFSCLIESAIKSKDLDFSLYKMKQLSPDYRLHWRVLKDKQEIEFVVVVNGTSWVGLGWRPRQLTAKCRNFPYIEGGEDEKKANLKAPLGPRPEPHPEGAAEPHPEGAAEPHPEGSAEPHAEGTAEPHPEGAAEPHPEGHAEPASETSPEPKSESSAEPSSEVTAEPASEVTAEPASEETAEPASEVTAEPTGEPETESEPPR